MPKQPPNDPQIDFASIKARVTKVTFDRLRKTHDDVFFPIIQDVLKVQDFKQLLLETTRIKNDLEEFGAFRKVEVLIDEAKGESAGAHDVEVTFKVTEASTFVPGITPIFQDNESTIAVGAKWPNLFGRGESLQCEKQYGTSQFRGTNLVFMKPFPQKGIPRLTGALYTRSAVLPGHRAEDCGGLLELGWKLGSRVHHFLRAETIWRHLGPSPLTPTPFDLRLHLGHSLKCSLKHTIFINKLGLGVIPRDGYQLQLQQELAGWGGDVSFVKQEAAFKLSGTPLNHLTLQAAVSAGLLHGLKHTISDRFYPGGPMGVRGFTPRGVGPHDKGCPLGNAGFLAAALHLYCPLPFQPWRHSSFGQALRSHLFICSASTSNGPSVDELLRDLVWSPRLTAGAGLLALLGSSARLELNYVVVLSHRPGDRARPGLQLGIGFDYL